MEKATRVSPIISTPQFNGYGDGCQRDGTERRKGWNIFFFNYVCFQQTHIYIWVYLMSVPNRHNPFNPINPCGRSMGCESGQNPIQIPTSPTRPLWLMCPLNGFFSISFPILFSYRKWSVRPDEKV